MVLEVEQAHLAVHEHPPEQARGRYRVKRLLSPPRRVSRCPRLRSEKESGRTLPVVVGDAGAVSRWRMLCSRQIRSKSTSPWRGPTAGQDLAVVAHRHAVTAVEQGVDRPGGGACDDLRRDAEPCARSSRTPASKSSIFPALVVAGPPAPSLGVDELVADERPVDARPRGQRSSCRRGQACSGSCAAPSRGAVVSSRRRGPRRRATWCGQLFGRELRSASPGSPSAA